MIISGTENVFRFKEFALAQDQCAMKVGTDGILLGAWARVEEAQKVLDIGTGTGLIALMLAQRQAQAKVIGIEIDQSAACQAQKNVAESPFRDRVEIVHGSIQDYARTATELFGLIVSNPPFFSGGVMSENAGRAEVRHTIKLSHHDLLRSVQLLLKPEGRFCLVLPWLEGLRFQELAETYQLYTQHICKVSPRPDKTPNRLLLELGKSKTANPQTSSLTIYRTADGIARSDEFATLTNNFYL